MINTIIFDFDGVIHDTFRLAYETSQFIEDVRSVDEYKDLFNGNIYSTKKLLKK